MKLLQKKQHPKRRRVNSNVRTSRAPEAELETRYAFRRNRTLTGSLSSRVESVGGHSAELRSPRVQVHDLRRHRRRVGLILSGVALVVAGLSLLIYQSIALPHVSAVTSRPIDSHMYEQKIQEYLSGRPIERYRFSIHLDNLATYLQTNGFPEVLSIAPDLHFDGLGATRFVITMRQAVVSWKSGSSQVYVDDKGNAFSRNYFEEPQVRITDKSGIQTKNNQVIASNRLLAFIGKVIGRMQANGFSVTQVTLPAETTRQVEVSMESVNYPVKFSIDRSIGEQSEDASRAIRYVDSQGIVPQYLDVRVSGRAYYKDK